MKFVDFICREAILAQLKAQDKEGAIREMVQALREAGKIQADELDSIVEAILKRDPAAWVHDTLRNAVTPFAVSVIANETESDRPLAESLVKQLTGSDTIRARRMRSLIPTTRTWSWGI